MNAVGDGVDGVAREHEARHFSVLFGNAVYVAAQVEGEIGHVQNGTVSGNFLEAEKVFAVTDHPARQVQGELIVPGGDRGMGREDALFPDRFYVVRSDHLSSGFLRLLVQELQGEEACVPFIHMEAPDVVVAELTEHPDAADPENHLLTQPVVRVPSVKRMGQYSGPIGIFRKIGIQKIDRNNKPACALNLVFPGTELDRLPL